MATPAYPPAKPARTPLQKAARTANMWGWSYILTILGVFGANYVDAGPLRVLLLNLGILCFIVGVFELIWRRQLLKTGEAKWARVLMWNQVAGTASLAWSIYLLYKVPEKVLIDYAKKSDMWNSAMPLLKSLNQGMPPPESMIEHVWHFTKMLGVYGIGGALMLSQIWVLWHYWQMAREIEQMPKAGAVPPVL